MTFYLNTIQTRQEPAQLTPNLEDPTEVTQNSWLRLKIKSMGHERYKQKIPMSPSLRIQPNPTMRGQKTEGHSNGGIKPPCVCHFQLYYVPTLGWGGGGGGLKDTDLLYQTSKDAKKLLCPLSIAQEAVYVKEKPLI